MPGLFIPRFRPTDAIDARLIDRCVQSIADVLNGGLTAENLYAGYRLPSSAFAEDRTVCALKAFVDANSIDGSNNAIPLFGAITEADSSIVGMGYALKADSFVATSRRLDIMGGAAGTTLIFRHNIPRQDMPVGIGGTEYLIGFVQPRFSPTLAVNDILRLTWPTAPSSSPVGAVTLFLSTKGY